MSRTERISSLLRREISEILRLEFDNLGFISITTVDVAKDLSRARVLYSQIGSDSEKEKTRRLLMKSAGYINGRLAKTLTLKYIPKLRFEYDESLEKGADVVNRLNQLSRDRDEDE